MRTHVRTIIGSGLVLAAVAFVAVAAAREPAPAPGASGATIADFAWIAGDWRLDKDGEQLAEQWTKPFGNSMAGTFRWLRDGRAWLYEFMTIEESDAGIAFHLRHFGPGSIAWEGKTEPMAYPLLEVRADRAVFENPKRDEPRRFVFERSDGGRVLRIQLVGVNEDGTLNDGMSFEFKLAGG